MKRPNAKSAASPTPPAPPPRPNPPRRPASSRFEPKAILFDFDGVIVHSEPLHFQAMRETLRSEGIELTEQQYFRHCIGRDDRGAFRAVFDAAGKPLEPKTLLRILTVKSRRMRDLIHEGKYAALPGVSELVRGLVRHYPLAICSGALRDEIEAMLEGIALRDCFTLITAAEDVEVGKPDPSGYLQTLQQLAERTGLALTPRDSLVIEDAPNVIAAVRAVGFRTLGVAGSCSLADLAHADVRVSRLTTEEVARVLPKLKTSV